MNFKFKTQTEYFAFVITHDLSFIFLDYIGHVRLAMYEKYIVLNILFIISDTQEVCQYDLSTF